jgi:transposase-like protein
VIDVLVYTRRNAAAAQALFIRALRYGPTPVEVVTDRAPAYPRVVDEAAPTARHLTEQYATDENVNSEASGCCSVPLSGHAVVA